MFALSETFSLRDGKRSFEKRRSRVDGGVEEPSPVIGGNLSKTLCALFPNKQNGILRGFSGVALGSGGKSSSERLSRQFLKPPASVAMICRQPKVVSAPKVSSPGKRRALPLFESRNHRRRRCRVNLLKVSENASEKF